MTSLPADEVDRLWSKMGERRDWTNFMKAVMSQCGRTMTMDNLTVDHLVREAYDLKNNNFTFPESADGLYQVLSQRLD